MIDEIVLALGLVAVLEGLVLALIPKRLEDALKILASLSIEKRKTIGLCIVGFGVLV
ncbi:MAG: DUF2065 family protein, partial [Rhodobacteraceae bacterium]|nr:DUF2065 family protein [Paracoccaceae bacterium]